MVIDWLFGPVVAAVGAGVDKLPQGHALALPSLTPLWDLIAGLDSIVPIMGPLTVMLGVLGFGAAFIVVRLVLTVWNLLYP